MRIGSSFGLLILVGVYKSNGAGPGGCLGYKKQVGELFQQPRVRKGKSDHLWDDEESGAQNCSY